MNGAVTLGDAGTAVQRARRVAIDAAPINQRKASLLLNTSCAFLIQGKHDQPRSSSAAKSRATAPVTVRRVAREYAESPGVTA